MATREEVDELRARVERSDTTALWLGRAQSTVAIVAGFLALLLIFTR